MTWAPCGAQRPRWTVVVVVVGGCVACALELEDPQALARQAAIPTPSAASAPRYGRDLTAPSVDRSPAPTRPPGPGGRPRSIAALPAGGPRSSPALARAGIHRASRPRSGG